VHEVIWSIFYRGMLGMKTIIIFISLLFFCAFEGFTVVITVDDNLQDFPNASFTKNLTNTEQATSTVNLTPPSTPENFIISSQDQFTFILSWNHSQDPDTPQNQIQYILQATSAASVPTITSTTTNTYWANRTEAAIRRHKKKNLPKITPAQSFSQ